MIFVIIKARFRNVIACIVVFLGLWWLGVVVNVKSWAWILSFWTFCTVLWECIYRDFLTCLYRLVQMNFGSVYLWRREWFFVFQERARRPRILCPNCYATFGWFLWIGYFCGSYSYLVWFCWVFCVELTMLHKTDMVWWEMVKCCY